MTNWIPNYSLFDDDGRIDIEITRTEQLHKARGNEIHALGKDIGRDKLAESRNQVQAVEQQGGHNEEFLLSSLVDSLGLQESRVEYGRYMQNYSYGVQERTGPPGTAASETSRFFLSGEYRRSAHAGTQTYGGVTSENQVPSRNDVPTAIAHHQSIGGVGRDSGFAPMPMKHRQTSYMQMNPHGEHVPGVMHPQQQYQLPETVHTAGTMIPAWPGYPPQPAREDVLPLPHATQMMMAPRTGSDTLFGVDPSFLWSSGDLSHKTVRHSVSDVQQPIEDEECLVGLEGAYQPYCHQIITPALNEAAQRVLHTLKNVQSLDTTSKMGKRYFCSLKEVSKVAKTCKLLIIAPDVRPSAAAHVKPVRLLMNVIKSAESAGVPYIFALSRRGIGQVFGRDKSMSIVAVMNLEDIETDCAIMASEATKGRQLFASRLRMTTR